MRSKAVRNKGKSATRRGRNNNNATRAKGSTSHDPGLLAQNITQQMSLPAGSGTIQRCRKANLHVLSNSYDGGLQDVNVP